jgi:hypothetical protein
MRIGQPVSTPNCVQSLFGGHHKIQKSKLTLFKQIPNVFFLLQSQWAPKSVSALKRTRAAALDPLHPRKPSRRM